MANQSNTSQPLMVWYQEQENSKRFKLSEWAKHKLDREPPIAELAKCWVVDKWRKLKQISIAIALGFSYTRRNNK